jgi:hypothetical protein
VQVNPEMFDIPPNIINNKNMAFWYRAIRELRKIE